MNDEKGTQKLPREDRSKRREKVPSKDHTRAAGKDAGGKKTLTQERLKELLYYDPDTGIFRWIVKRQPDIKPGDIAGCRHDAKGYRKVRIEGIKYFEHRLAWFYTHGVWPDGEIDRRDHNPSNNRILNLREGEKFKNLGNKIVAHKNNKTGTLGVCLVQGRWVAQIQINKKKIHLGSFDSQKEAREVYLSEKRKIHAFNML